MDELQISRWGVDWHSAERSANLEDVFATIRIFSARRTGPFDRTHQKQA
jgi:hypothetical protein